MKTVKQALICYIVCISIFSCKEQNENHIPIVENMSQIVTVGDTPLPIKFHLNTPNSYITSIEMSTKNNKWISINIDDISDNTFQPIINEEDTYYRITINTTNDYIMCTVFVVGIFPLFQTLDTNTLPEALKYRHSARQPRMVWEYNDDIEWIELPYEEGQYSSHYQPLSLNKTTRYRVKFLSSDKYSNIVTIQIK